MHKDVFEVIETDHRRLLALMQKMMATTTRARRTRQSQLEELREQLLSHLRVEENFFYPVVMMADADGSVMTADRDHESFRKALAEMEATAVDDASWPGRLRALYELLADHIEREELEILEIAQNLLDDRRARLIGKRFALMKRQDQGMLAGRRTDALPTGVGTGRDNATRVRRPVAAASAYTV